MSQRARYELKYVVEESRARAITGFLRSYLRPSSYNRPGTIPGQSVVSLYFDSPGLLFYRQNFAGLKNRIKLRVRFYNDDKQQPAFLEIKRRENEAICKERTKISREIIGQMLRQGWPSLAPGAQHATQDYGQRQAEVQQKFSRLCNAAQARALLYVSYLREAFVTADDGPLRVTMDRQIRATLYDGDDRLAVPRRGVAPSTHTLPAECVVLEMKFNRSCPAWMQKMVRVFNLHRRSVCKYGMCVEALRIPQGQQNAALSQWGTVA